jgi:excisionase family DNA binding protein
VVDVGDPELMEDLISIEDAAELLEVSPNTVRRLFDAGKLRGHRLPKGHRRILRKSVEELHEELLEQRDPTIITFRGGEHG